MVGVTAAVVLAFVLLFVVVLAVLWRLRPARLKLTLKVWRLVHLELESETRTKLRAPDRPAAP